MADYLLDTHTLLWYAQRSPQLPDTLLKAIQEPTITAYISRVSLLEVTIKVSIGKLQLPLPLVEWLERTTTGGFGVLEITNSHLVNLATLPLLPNHRDPFDRLLIAQALTENLTLVSRDGKFGEYAGLKLQWA